MRLIATIRPAHFDEFLHARFGEHRGHMVGPIRQSRLFARQRRQLAGQKIPERLTQRIDILAVAVDKIHRHIQHPIDVALKAETRVKRKRQHAGAAVVEAPPDPAAPGFMPVQLAVKERRRGEQRRCHRLQRQSHPQLFHHVGLGGIVQIDLHCAGPIHHLGAMRANPAHVVGHQPIPALRHHRHLIARPLRRGTDAHELDPQRISNRCDFIQMVLQFRRDFANRDQWRAGQFELATGFKTDIGTMAGQADHLVAFAQGRPAKPRFQSSKQRRNRALARIGQWRTAVGQPAEFLMLGANAPVRFRLAARRHHLGQCLIALDRATTGLRDRHDRMPFLPKT